MKEGFGQPPQELRLDAVNRERMKLSEQGDTGEGVSVTL